MMFEPQRTRRTAEDCPKQKHLAFRHSSAVLCVLCG
jgi:hypothetical protein